MKQSIDVENVQTLKLDEDDILVVTVDISDMAPNIGHKYMNNVQEFFKERVDNKVLVISQHITLMKINDKEIENDSNTKKSP